MKKNFVQLLVLTICLYVTLSLAYGELIQVWFALLVAALVLLTTYLMNIAFDWSNKTKK